MNKLGKLVGVVSISAVSLISSANADSSAFTGAYVGITGSALGIAMDGKHTRTLGEASVTNGAVGAVTESAGAEMGYSYPISDMFFVTVGASLSPFSTTIDAKDITEAKNVKLTTDDIITYFIEPSYNVTENTALFMKLGASDSEIKATGTEVTNKTYDFSGETIAFGTKTVTDDGVFMKTEAGITSYDTLKITNINEEFNGTSSFTATATADVDVAYGQITLGYKF